MKKTLFLILIVFSLFSVEAQKKEFWGMTSGGTGAGSIFKTDSVGNNMQLVYAFDNTGESPRNTHFTQALNGKLYAVASGGKYGCGIIFKYDQYNNIYTKVYDFDGAVTGKVPVGGLLLASNGKLYGMCKYGGQHNLGVIYEYNTVNDSVHVVFNFDTISAGCYPNAGLIQATNGKLYGLTIGGYVAPSLVVNGTLFEFDLTTKTISKKVEFCGINDQRPNIGSRPMGGLIQATNGKLYGTTQFGGGDSLINGGTIFEYDIINDTIIIKHSFTSVSYLGNYPLGTLIQMPSGKMYGYSNNMLFEFNPQNNQYSEKCNFISQSIGFFPEDQLTKGVNGRLYGVCSNGGASGHGTLFEYNPQTGQCVKKIDFDGITKGSKPCGGLCLASNGVMYGTAYQGGIAGYGTIFEYNYTTTSSFVKDYDFVPSINGANPKGSLLLASNGKFYGMTQYGGIYNRGVLFEIDPVTQVYSKKFDFNDTIGAYPKGTLFEASNGKLYAFTSGGYFNRGTIIEYDFLNDSIKLLKSLYGGSFGGVPIGDFIQGSAIKLYGMSSDYWAGKGVIIEYDMVFDTFYSHALTYQTGHSSEGSFIKHNNAILIALMKEGGANNKGTVMSYNMTNHSVSALASFTESNGAYPTGNLVKATNGKYYGLTSGGGVLGNGVLFEYSNSTITKKIDFNSVIGAKPYGSLMLASNGKLYGMTKEGGIYNKGVLFEYNPSNGVYTIKHFFDGTKGAAPYYSYLVEYEACANVSASTISVLTCNQYTSPSGKVWTQSGIYTDTVLIQYNCDSIITINLIVSHVDTSVSVSGATLSANYNGGTYQWLDCDNAFAPILGATAQSYMPSINGHYAVMVAGNGCIDTSACYAINTVGIVENTFETTINVFPNPTTGKLSVLLGTDCDEIELSVRNAMGKLVFQKHYFDTNRIDLNLNVAKGIYLLELRDMHGRRSLFKIVKE